MCITSRTRVHTIATMANVGTHARRMKMPTNTRNHSTNIENIMRPP